ncbi:MAG: GNAT family N-acetyltransferase [Deltaproteobacteria bacterium]|nr:GNAT family N-acetyltransferase [Deltaproteobacteria bacterium]
MFVDVTADDPRLAAFHAGIYMDAFAAQQEPLAVWQSALRGEKPYALTVRLALDGDAIAGGIAFELYPRSRCGLLTYLVVAPHARNRGLGEQMFREAAAELRARGARAVLGEVHGEERLRRFAKWGAQRVDVPYVQPSLAPGLPRDADLVLISVGPAERTDIEAFIDELYTVCEG